MVHLQHQPKLRVGHEIWVGASSARETLNQLNVLLLCHGSESQQHSDMKGMHQPMPSLLIMNKNENGFMLIGDSLLIIVVTNISMDR